MVRCVPLCTDKMASQVMLTELVRKVDRTKAGLVDYHDEHQNEALTKHLKEFEEHLKANGCTLKHAYQVASRARKLPRLQVSEDWRHHAIQG